ncbi:MAG: hypothetical protein SGILL_010076, partial [Bacillariaceae sp.]
MSSLQSLLRGGSRLSLAMGRQTVTFNPAAATASWTAAAANSTQRSFHATAQQNSGNTYHGTTILCVRKNGKVCMMGDGMVSMGNMTIKPNAVKIQRLFPKGLQASEENHQKATLVGFA